MSSSMKAAIHLGPIFKSNSEIYKNLKFEDIESVFNITQKSVTGHSEEILKKYLEYSSPSWARSTSVNDQAIQWAKAKVCVYASVLCVGQTKDSPGAVERWKGQVHGLSLYSSYQDAVGIEGDAIEFEWKNFPGFPSLSSLEKIQEDLETRRIQPDRFTDRTRGSSEAVLGEQRVEERTSAVGIARSVLQSEAVQESRGQGRVHAHCVLPGPGHLTPRGSAGGSIAAAERDEEIRPRAKRPPRTRSGEAPDADAREIERLARRVE